MYLMLVRLVVDRISFVMTKALVGTTLNSISEVNMERLRRAWHALVGPLILCKFFSFYHKTANYFRLDFIFSLRLSITNSQVQKHGAIVGTTLNSISEVNMERLRRAWHALVGPTLIFLF